jgi:putative hydrolase of the HAD superfamily
VQEIEPFDRERTLFVDDSLSVLRSAREFGFEWLVAVLEPDSKGPRREIEDFPAIRNFAELLPGLQAAATSRATKTSPS